MLYIMINGEKIIRDESYSMTIIDKLADSSGDTEAGTKQYDYVRRNVHTISLNYRVTDKWLKKFSYFRNEDTLKVSFYDEIKMKMCEDVPMKMTQFSYEKEYSKMNYNIWSVSFNLEEI